MDLITCKILANLMNLSEEDIEDISGYENEGKSNNAKIKITNNAGNKFTNYGEYN